MRAVPLVERGCAFEAAPIANVILAVAFVRIRDGREDGVSKSEPQKQKAEPQKSAKGAKVRERIRLLTVRPV